MNEEKCKDCGETLVELHPPVEDYLENKFCIKIFGWKLMLFRETTEYDCVRCLQEIKDSQESDMYDAVVHDTICREIERGHLIINE